MPIPESAKQQLYEILEEQQTLTQANLTSLIVSLDQGKPVNWNLMLNSEIKEGGEDEAHS
jgi:hypothetical protein